MEWHQWCVGPTGRITNNHYDHRLRGIYSFPELAAGKTYTVVPAIDDFVFIPEKTTFEDLSENRVLNFVGKRTIFYLAGSVTDDNGDPLGDVTVSLTGSKSSSV